jgi:pimeloyl-ACP methyl ester carboxylesterase
MYIKRYGNGPRVFFGIHGWSGDHRTFEPLARFVPPEASLLACDLPGIGQSKPLSEWSMRLVAGEVSEAIYRIGQPITLVGNCSGANIAFFAAQMIPDRIERLITIDVFAFWPWYFRVFVNRWIGRYAYFSTFANPMGRWITNLSLSSKRRESTTLTGGFSRVDHAVTYRYLNMLKESGNIDRFRDLRLPCDLVYGENSFAAARESAVQLAALWPGSRTFPLPGAGHLPIIEASAALAQIIFTGNNRELLCPTPAIHCAN